MKPDSIKTQGLLLTIALTFILMLSGCSKDNDDSIEVTECRSMLVGVWTQKSYGYAISNPASPHTFNDDNTYSGYFGSGSWFLSDGMVITIRVEKNGSITYRSCRITYITDTEMTLLIGNTTYSYNKSKLY